MTVSRVVNNQPNVKPKTRERVLKAIKKLGYYPNAAARALSSNKSHNVGIIVPSPNFLVVAPFTLELYFGVERRLKKDGYNLFLSSMTSETELMNLPALFRGGKVDGIIIFAPKIRDMGVEKLAEGKYPFVVVYGRGVKTEISYVDSDNIKGTSLVMRYLFGLGHRRIGFVSGDMDVINSVHRFDQYKRELESEGIPFDQSLVYYGDWSLESGYAGFTQLAGRSPRPTAIFFSNDQMAIGAIKAAQEMKIRIPEDISITGFDDTHFASFVVPPLTTVRQNTQVLGEAVGEMILESIEGNSAVRKIILEPEFVIRSSCCPPANN